MGKCPLCDGEAREQPLFTDNPPRHFIDCKTCGRFLIDSHLQDYLPVLPEYKDRRYLLQGLIRNRPEGAKLVEITRATIDQVLSTCDPPRNPLEAMDRLLGLALTKTSAASDWIVFE